MLRTVIYIRKSSEDETEKQAGSFDRQWRDLEEFIEKQNQIRPEHERFSFDPDKDILYEDKSAKKE
jgi:DNA invertase Pin-like site-specific DNA recombinase